MPKQTGKKVQLNIGAAIRTQDWEHRLHVLSAWRTWRHRSASVGEDGATYRAVLDGCAITIRALCDALGVKCSFVNKTISAAPSRFDELFACCYLGRELICKLEKEHQRCLLEVLYLGNRAIAHPGCGGLDHAAGSHEMTIAINVLLEWILVKSPEWAALKDVPVDLLQPIA